KGLFELGFDEPTLFHLVDAVPNVTAYKILLVNRPAGDKALVSAVIARHRRVFLVEFSTRFGDGEVFDTHNISIPLTCPFPGHVRTQVPQVTDVRQLYKLHTYILNKHGAVRGTVLHEPGRALDYFAQVTFPEFTEEQVNRGWMYYREGTDCYHYTIKGAFLMTWGLMQPFKAIRKSLMWRRARAIMDEFKQHTSD